MLDNLSAPDGATGCRVLYRYEMRSYGMQFRLTSRVAGKPSSGHRPPDWEDALDIVESSGVLVPVYFLGDSPRGLLKISRVRGCLMPLPFQCLLCLPYDGTKTANTRSGKEQSP